jgi:glycosyltransferase involved in cell wall biosynthesis
MERRYPRFKEKFATIAIPYNIKKIKDSADRKDNLSRNERELLDDDYFVAVTRLSKDKDLDTIIRAYKLFSDETSSQTKLYFIGDGRDRARLEELVRDYGLSKMIIFLGRKNEPYVFVKNSKASILSSKEEGAPLVIVEGMILKTIVVSSDCPTAPRELLDNGKYGVLFEPGNANELKNIMIKIDNNQITKEQFSQNDKWIDRFDTNKITSQLELIIKRRNSCANAGIINDLF